MAAQLLTLLDGAAARGGASAGRLAVVAATNRPNALDPALRRPGRLDREIAVPVPSPAARAAILRLHAAGQGPGSAPGRSHRAGPGARAWAAAVCSLALTTAALYEGGFFSQAGDARLCAAVMQLEACTGVPSMASSKLLAPAAFTNSYWPALSGAKRALVRRPPLAAHQDRGASASVAVCGWHGCGAPT